MSNETNALKAAYTTVSETFRLLLYLVSYWEENICRIFFTSIWYVYAKLRFNNNAMSRIANDFEVYKHYTYVYINGAKRRIR